MIIFDKNSKNLDIPVGLGNLEVNIVTPVSPGSIIESAVTEANQYTDEQLESSLTNYYTSAQTQEAISSALTDYATSAETAEAISTATQGMVTSTQINKIWTGTQAEYDQISPKLNTTLYFIKDS